jgi:hypothetical protein
MSEPSHPEQHAAVEVHSAPISNEMTDLYSAKLREDQLRLRDTRRAKVLAAIGVGSLISYIARGLFMVSSWPAVLAGAAVAGIGTLVASAWKGTESGAAQAEKDVKRSERVLGVPHQG